MMDHDRATTERLQKLISQITALTRTGGLRWQRQQGSAHRFARWNNNLLILGPAEIDDERIPRYLFITPFDSPDCIEVNSNDRQLGSAIIALFKEVDTATRNEPAVDPFAMNPEILDQIDISED